ncbi:MAG TPA: hypothetical protein VGZ06_03805 [Candidatus Cybelea sp.]|jgi:hypothetical protein|nr:hypothetical protein [Candidatus Cybelea sp.]
MTWGISIPRIDWSAIALLSSAALTAVAAPDTSVRHAVAGHFSVPPASPTPGAPAAGTNAVSNGGFETGNVDDGWYQCGDVNAYVIKDHPRSGEHDEYSGTFSGSGEPVGNSGLCQSVTIPPGGVLSASLYQLSNEADTSFAYQEADLLDNRGNVVLNLYKTVNDKGAWVRASWNLAAYAGRTYWLYFGVHGDGYSKRATQQFVDDVVLTGSTSREGEDIPHATPGPNAGARARR